ncbi:MAG TPA: substrate-binding domain-containing protein [Rhizomicrobium sp.]|jgi:molybdate transport system substrate-binding protein
MKIEIGANRVSIWCTSALMLGLLCSTAEAQTTTPENVANAQPGDVRLMITDGLKVPLGKVRADLQSAVGHPLIFEFSESHVLQRQMETGQPFEVALVTQDVVEAEIAKGNMLPEHPVIARIHVGFFQRGDAPAVDVSTPEAVKKALLGAKSIRWSANAAAEPSVLNILNRLKLNDAVKSKVHTTVMGQPVQPVDLGPGEYELLINIVGEGSRPPFVFLGNAPAQLEVPVVLMAGIGSKGDPATARAVVRYLMNPAFDPVLQASNQSR